MSLSVCLSVFVSSQSTIFTEFPFCPESGQYRVFGSMGEGVVN